MDLIAPKCLVPRPCSSSSNFGNSDSTIPCVAKGLVEQAVCTASELIKLDPAELFLYKRPKVREHLTVSTAISYASSYSTSSSDVAVREKNENIDWLSIQNFSTTEAMTQLREFIDLWVLTPATMFVLIAPRVPEIVRPLGMRYFVDALFSKPTPRCPNPLAVAKVHFYLHLSWVLPPEYPIMVTYRFEGFETAYYALGRRSLRSMHFQRFFIDTILQMKLSFYAEICECRNPREERVVVMKLQSDTDHDNETAFSKRLEPNASKSMQSAFSMMSTRSEAISFKTEKTSSEI